MLVVLVSTLVLLADTSGAARADHGGWSALGMPVEGDVVAWFDAPTRYGPGHRGIDVAVEPGTPVVAVAAGRVGFAGSVVGDRWVTVDHGGLRTTVGPLRSIAVVTGQVVARGTPLGTSGFAHGLPAVHLSARVGERYVDPLRVRSPVVSLLPPGTMPRLHDHDVVPVHRAARPVTTASDRGDPTVSSGAWRTLTR